MTLRLDWCARAAAQYAVMHWHYSRSMPAGKLACVGAWEGDRYIGAVMFGRGANRNAGKPYACDVTEIAELVRVALDRHEAPTSRIVAIAVRMLRKQSPGVRLLFSYADPVQSHHGGIYQAMGWIYVGTSRPQADVNGEHKRSASGRRGSLKGATFTATIPKHKYLLPLDDAMRAQIAPLARPYPKRVRGAEIGTAVPTAGGGENPTRTLQSGALVIPERRPQAPRRAQNLTSARPSGHPAAPDAPQRRQTARRQLSKTR
jgi:hypothetical protein